MLEWKRSDPKYNESVRAIDFSENMPEVAKQLQDEKGQWVNGKTFTQGEWTYKAKSWTPKDSTNTLWFVERFVPKPAGSSRGMSKEEYAKRDADRNAAIAKAHAENLAVENRKADSLNRIAVGLENLNATLTVVLGEFRRTNEFLEAIARTLPLQHFKKAKEV